MNTTPVSLLERLKQSQDTQAWERFVELYTPVLYSWAKHTGLQPTDAADLVQDVLLLLVKKLPEFTYNPSKKFRHWLRTVTLNKWRENYRRADVLEKGQTQPLPELVEPDAAAEFWEHEYQQQLVQQALVLMQSNFQPESWRAFWECVVNGRTPDEVAAELQISRNAVYIAKSRVLAHLREELDGLAD